MAKSRSSDTSKIRIWVALGATLIIGSLVYAVRVHYLTAFAKLSKLDSFTIKPSEISIKGVPTQFSSLVRTDIRRRFKMLPRLSIFDPRLLSLVAEKLRQSPWVLRINRLEKSFPRYIKAEIVWREPCAYVFTDAFYLVSRHCVRLPVCKKGWDGRLVTVVGVKTPPPGVGERWRDPALSACVRFIEKLKREPIIIREGLCVVDISNYDRKLNPFASEVLILTRSRVQILWGALEQKPTEPDYDTKLKLLEKAISQEGKRLVDLRTVKFTGENS